MAPRRRNLVALAALLAAGAAGAIGGAAVRAVQPPQPPDAKTPASAPPATTAQAEPNPPGTPPAPTRDDRAISRGMLVRWLTDMEKRRLIFEEAVRRLDRGESVEAVRAYVRENAPPLWRFDRGGREEDPLGAGPSSTDRPQSPRAERSASAPLTADDRAALKEIFGAYDPAAWERVEKLNAEDPKKADEKLIEARHRLRWLIEMRRNDADMYRYRLAEFENEQKARRLARQIVEAEKLPTADPARINADRIELRRLLMIRQGARIAAQTLELVRLEEHLNKVRKSIEEKTASSGQTLDDDVSEFLRKAAQPPGPNGDDPEPPGRRPHRPDGDNRPSRPTPAPAKPAAAPGANG